MIRSRQNAKLYFLLSLILSLFFLSPTWARDLAWHPISGPEAQRVLVPGDHPLRLGDLNVFLNCLEFGLGIALTEANTERFRSQIMEEFLQQKGHLLESISELKSMWGTITTDGPGGTGKFRRIIQDALIEEARKNPKFPLSQSILQLERHASEIVVPGSPPLSRHSLEAFMEIVRFAMKLRDKRHSNPDPATQKIWENVLIKRTSHLTPEGRRWLSNADFHRAIIMKAWQETPSEEKASIRKLMIETFAPSITGGTGLDLDAIPLPPPNLFPLPVELPWDFR